MSASPKTPPFPPSGEFLRAVTNSARSLCLASNVIVSLRLVLVSIRHYVWARPSIQGRRSRRGRDDRFVNNAGEVTWQDARPTHWFGVFAKHAFAAWPCLTRFGTQTTYLDACLLVIVSLYAFGLILDLRFGPRQSISCFSQRHSPHRSALCPLPIVSRFPSISPQLLRKSMSSPFSHSSVLALVMTPLCRELPLGAYGTRCVPSCSLCI